ncbi:MAG: hypothetical protein ACI3W5_07585 [Faecousia sp.]
MIKEALEYLVGLKPVQTFVINGETYTDGSLSRVPKVKHSPERYAVKSLDAIANLIKTEIGKARVPLFIRIDSPTRVFVESTWDSEFDRDFLYQASCEEANFQPGWRDHEKAIIELKSAFIPTEGQEYLLDLLSRLCVDDRVETTDNGVTQTVTTKQGVSLKQAENVRNIVGLKPFRTFREVNQPESMFLIRVDDKYRVAILEADGEIWKIEAKLNIKAYFEEELADYIADGSVVVLC